VPKVICGVCHGKGGFKNADVGWVDCLYCDKYGFVDDHAKEHECREDLLYNKYRNALVSQLQILGTVKVCSLSYIKIDPFDKRKWVSFLKSVLKYSHHNENINICVKHVFEYGKDGRIIDFWELIVSTKEMKDIEGLIELLKFHNKTVRRISDD